MSQMVKTAIFAAAATLRTYTLNVFNPRAVTGMGKTSWTADNNTTPVAFPHPAMSPTVNVEQVLLPSTITRTAVQIAVPNSLEDAATVATLVANKSGLPFQKLVLTFYSNPNCSQESTDATIKLGIAALQDPSFKEVLTGRQGFH